MLDTGISSDQWILVEAFVSYIDCAVQDPSNCDLEKTCKPSYQQTIDTSHFCTCQCAQKSNIILP